MAEETKNSTLHSGKCGNLAQTKEKMRWKTVNTGDVKATALFDVARAIRNARLLERAAQNYILEDCPPDGGHMFVSRLMQWPIVWTDTVALLFDDSKSRPHVKHTLCEKIHTLCPYRSSQPNLTKALTILIFSGRKHVRYELSLFCFG